MLTVYFPFDIREVSNAYAENQKIVAIRKVYHRAIILPIINVEQLWKDYNTFEQVRCNKT